MGTKIEIAKNGMITLLCGRRRTTSPTIRIRSSTAGFNAVAAAPPPNLKCSLGMAYKRRHLLVTDFHPSPALRIVSTHKFRRVPGDEAIRRKAACYNGIRANHAIVPNHQLSATADNRRSISQPAITLNQDPATLR